MKNRLFLIIILTIIFSKVVCPIYAQNDANSTKKVTVQADRQNYNGEKNEMTFDGNVKVDFDNISIKSPKASMRTGVDGKPESAVFTDGAEATKVESNSSSSVKAKIIKVSILENKFKAEGMANTVMLENKQPVVTIKSNSQEFNMDDNSINAAGNVIINYKNIATSSNQAEISVDKATGKPSQVNLIGAARVVEDKNVVSGANVLINLSSNELISSGNAISQTLLDDATKVLIRSDYQHFDQKSNTLITSGRVKVDYKGYIASGPKATFLPGPNGKPNKIVFMGRSRIQEGSRVVEADKLEITVNPKNFFAEGNVKSQFTQIQKPKPDTSRVKKYKNIKNIQPIKPVKPVSKPENTYIAPTIEPIQLNNSN